jgi:hypothetical protein
MTIDRRTFLVGTGLAATAPVLAGLVSLPAMAQRREAASPDVLPATRQTAPVAPDDAVVFGIAGWSVGNKAPDSDTILFNLNQSWMSAWR